MKKRSKVLVALIEPMLVEGMRDQALRDAESCARAKAYSAAANWQAWAQAFDHLLVTVRAQAAIGRHRNAQSRDG